MSRVRMLIHFGITPYLVFDGDYLPSKSTTEDERAKRRQQSKAFGLQLYRAGKVAQAQAELQKAVDITPEMAGQFIEELRKHNIQFVVAPYEADAQLVYLESRGIIQGIISEDSDLLVFGAQRLLTKLDQYGECVEINRDQFTACSAVSLVGWTDAEFRHMAILSGCDYLPSVNKLGLKTAHSLVRKYNSIDRIIQRLRFDAKYTVPTDYPESFRRAELTFLHQWVFCPEEKKLIMRTPLEKCEFSDLDFLGKDLDPTVARGVATGRLHPGTKKPLVPKIVPLRNSQSPWGAAGKGQLATPLSKVGKPIDQYFKNRRVPLAELDPNTFTPSPSQQVLQANANRAWFSSPAPGGLEVPTPTHTPATVDRRFRVRGISSRLGNVPSKRPRLCNEEEDILDDKNTTVDARSRFFSSQTTKPSPLEPKMPRRKPKNETINIWSDDSINEELVKLPELSTPLNDQVRIHRDGPAKRSGKERTGSEMKSQSCLWQGSSLAESTQATSVNLMGSPGTSGSDMVRHAGGRSTLDRRESEGLDRDCLASAASGDPPEVIPQSPPLTRGQACAEQHSPKQETRNVLRYTWGPVSGSEDLLVPQSDDESTPGSPPTSRALERPKLDLGRFLFTG